MNVPDYVAPIIGYRAWHWDGAKLTSLNGEPWCPGRPLTANCGFRGHQVPQIYCGCGIYANNRLDQCYHHGIYGEVYLWGTVVEHECGWRAQHAYPKTLLLSHHEVSFKRKLRSERGLAPLTAYGADIYLALGEGHIPIWSPAAGYDAEGLKRLKDLPPWQPSPEEQELIALLREMRKRKPDDREGSRSAFSSSVMLLLPRRQLPQRGERAKRLQPPLPASPSRRHAKP